MVQIKTSYTMLLNLFTKQIPQIIFQCCLLLVRVFYEKKEFPAIIKILKTTNCCHILVFFSLYAPI